MIRALGMMSGTSMDGVDAAMIETDGITIAGFGRHAFRPTGANEAALLRGALGGWPGDPGVAEATRMSEDAHAALAREFPEAQLIGYHGQTLAHDPGGRGTHQAGSGARLAARTGRPVVWDFRSEDVRRGGEGAPLAPFFHWACARWAVGQGRLAPGPVAFLNLGGVGNITLVDPRASAPELPGACLAFDTGPANAPLNDFMQRRRGQSHDAGGTLALMGHVSEDAVAHFLSDPWFKRPAPKSLDRDHFSALSGLMAPLSDADGAATLTALMAQAIAAGFVWFPHSPLQVLVCGGGRHNAAVMAALGRALSVPVAPVEAIGLDGDMLEAQAFGWLAVRVLRGHPTSGPETTGVPEPVCGGRISQPRKASGGRNVPINLTATD